jgi:ATP-dependent DNA helicase RecG
MTLQDLEHIAAAGESETVEFKKSTAQLTRVGETLSAFLNCQGGRIFIGVTPEGRVVGQQIADSTLRDVAATLARFEPVALISQDRIRLPNGLEVLVLSAPAVAGSGPFTFAGRACQRVGSTRSAMPQGRYEALLLERAHGRSRWENAPAVGISPKHLDRERILRTVRLGIEAGRLPESTGRDVGDILERLRLRRDGQILNAAVILFGKESLADYPQRQLRLARFKGTDKSEFLDNRQPRGHAFALLDEAMTFLHRHLPISGRFEAGRLERIDELLLPTAALREALVNALCHRDYAIHGGAVNVAVYDDRTEIWSDGTLPFGLRPEDLKREHTSHPRNPFITDVFYRRGLIEQWGRGTQKIVELCLKAGHPEPEFGEQTGSVFVRLWPLPHKTTQQGAEQVAAQDRPKTGPRPAQGQPKSLEDRVLVVLASGHHSAAEIAALLRQKPAAGQFKVALRQLLNQGTIEYTIPGKPRSRWQRYRLTAKGRVGLGGWSEGAVSIGALTRESC